MSAKKPTPNQPGLFDSGEGADSTSPPRQTLVVPFGKFKDQPADLLLAHADYAVWLLTAKAAMLRRSHPQLYHWLIGHFGAPDTTPEHNRLQNRFLDDNFRLQLVLHLNPGLDAQPPLYVTPSAVTQAWARLAPSRARKAYSYAQDHFGYGSKLTPAEKVTAARERALDTLSEDVRKVVIECSKSRAATHDEVRQFEAAGQPGVERIWSPVFVAGEPKFEVSGADVQFSVGASYYVRINEDLPCYPSPNDAPSGLLSYTFEQRLRVEVKPFVGDDYPVILRSMVAKSCNLLLVEAFEADGASWEPVTKVFASREIRVALLEDVLLTAIPDAVCRQPLPMLDRDGMFRTAEKALDSHLAAIADRESKRGVG